jgi:hypothetical protein
MRGAAADGIRVSGLFDCYSPLAHPAANGGFYFTVLAARRRDGGSAEFSGRCIERSFHAFSCRRGLHAGEQTIELGAEIVKRARACLDQLFEFLVGNQYCLGRIVPSDRHCTAARRLVEDGREFVLDPSRGDALNVDQFAVAVAEC